MAATVDQLSSNVIMDKQKESKERRICIVGNKLKTNLEIIKAAQVFNIPVILSESGSEYIRDDNFENVFILEEFHGQVFEVISKSVCMILGPTVLLQYANLAMPLPRNCRPLYTVSMQNLVICFTGFRAKEVMSKLASLIHHMGGCVRKDFSSKVTHVVANSTLGEKYRYAVTFGIPVMTEQWVYEAWSRRDDPNCSATDNNLMQLKLQPFHGCNISLFGFKSDEMLHMEELAVQNGGKVCKLTDQSCTHLVIEVCADITEDVRSSLNHKTHLVTSEWFWASIQMDACADESIYCHQKQESAVIQTPLFRVSSVCGHKRKRTKDGIRHLSVDIIPSQPNKLKSVDSSNIAVNSPVLDETFSPEGSFSIGSPEEITASPLKPILDLKSMTPRQKVCTELLQTETNYVGILHTIVTMFKLPLEQPDQAGGILLDGTEVKIIFGNIPPIYEVHTKLRDDIYALLSHWREENSIGNIILKHSKDFLKAYPPFVNFFEKTKEVLVQCDQTKPRFHAFLKRCQSKPECGRQSLVELMIRPVQRLPSMILLLNDILKHTAKSNPDYDALQKSVLSLKEVMNHINEDKRKTESQVVMFDIVNDIENCPPHLLSSHRTFIMETDVQEMGDSINSRGDIITMFLFTDMLEICKRRGKMSGTMKSPGAINLNTAAGKSALKNFKHLELLHLSHIKGVIDVKESEECKNVFALIVRTNDELKERLYKFVLIGEDKIRFLHVLCRNIANAHCRADSENLLTRLEAEQLAIDTNDSSSTLGKAFRLASKTRNKLGRALSMKKTPTKRGLSRAMSTIISPLRLIKSPTSGSVHCLNIGSTSNLAESVFINSLESKTSKMGKRTKSSSLGPSSSKHL